MVSDINIKGTNHKIGGSQADGQWVHKRVTVFTGATWSATGTQTYTVSNYLPDDIYTYEVIVACYATTGTTSGNGCTWWVMDSNNQFNQVMGYCITRTASNVANGNTGILPCKQVNGNLTLRINVTGVGGTMSNGFYLYGYRRLGGSGIPPTYYTLTINPTPADATVTFNKGTVVGNTCTVTAGTSVTYTVSKSGYTTKSATVTVNSNQTVNVSLSQAGLPMYGWTYTAGNYQYDVYVVGENSSNGYVVQKEPAKITAISGSIGASESKVSVEGYSYSGTYKSKVSYNGISLYIYTYFGVLSNATVGKKALTSPNALIQPPTSISSSQMKFYDIFGNERTCTRKSSIDTIFTGS